MKILEKEWILCILNIATYIFSVGRIGGLACKDPEHIYVLCHHISKGNSHSDIKYLRDMVSQRESHLNEGSDVINDNSDWLLKKKGVLNDKSLTPTIISVSKVRIKRAMACYYTEVV